MKKQLRAALGVFINTILFTLLVCPELYASEETLPTPEEIIAKNIEAIGGIKALKKIKNKKITVAPPKRTSGSLRKDAIIYWERPNKRYESDNGFRSGSNGKIAWIISRLEGRTRLIEEDELSKLLFILQFDGPDGPDARYKSMKTEGIEQINGKDCYKVVKTPEIGRERTVYYDKESFMIVKTTFYRNGNYKDEIYYEDYREINGILLPFKSVGKNEIVTYKKIELNIEMPEGIFDIPEEITEIMKQIRKQKQTGEWKRFDGTWKGTVPGSDGNVLDITYVFESSGYNLRGSVSTKLGREMFGGKIEGNKISFSVKRPGAIVYMNGMLSGDVINMIQKNGDDVKEFKIKRVKQGNEAG